MNKSSRSAFTLIELLTVIAIIAILAVVTAVVAGSFIRQAQMISAMNNMKQLGAGLINYTGTHDGQLPLAGQEHPGFGTSGPGEEDAWYNAVPRAAGARGVADYNFSTKAQYFSKANVLYVPAGKYPANPTAPLFAVAMNSLLRDPSSGTIPDNSIRLANFQAPARTLIFFEVGLPGEQALPGQSSASYDGGTKGTAGNLTARYKRPSDKADPATMRTSGTNLLFADGHAESLQVVDVISSSGGPYYPQLGQNGTDGKVCWTMDPETVP